MNSKIAYHRSSVAFNISGSWPQQSKLLQQTFPELAEGNKIFVSSEVLGLLNSVEDRLALSREETMKIVSKAFPRKAMQVRFKTRRNLTHRN